MSGVLYTLVGTLSIGLSLSGPTGQYFVREPVDVTAVAGDLLQLHCVVQNMKGACQWTKDGFGLGTDPNLPGFPRFSMDEEKIGDCHLNIFPVLPEDEGLYQCQIGAVAGTAPIVSDTAKVTVNAPPGQPHIQQATQTDILEVQEGDEVVLNCETNGAKPAAEMQWKDQSGKSLIYNLLETITKNERTKTFKTVSTLKFKPEQNMNITCSAFSEAFTEPRTSRQLGIQLRYKPKLSINITNNTIEDGTTLVLKCSSNAYPANVTFKWFVNGDEMEELSDTLTIQNVPKELNNAVIKCIAENSVGKSETNTKINVEFVPKILTHPTSKIAKAGEKVTFTCSAEGNPKPNYVWMKGKSQELVGVSQNLTLTATDDTEDEYTCKVFVDGHDILTSQTATLRIMRKPEVFTETFKYAKVGEDVILQCRVESLSNNTKVTWTKDDEPIDHENVKHRILYMDGLYQFSSDLIIYNTDKADFTNYGCFSSNEVGTDYKVMALQEEKDSDFLTIVLTVNTIVGVIILLFVLIYQNRKRRTSEESELPTVHQEDLPPIYRGKDPSVFEELLLNKGKHEDYQEFSKEYVDNIKNIKKVEDLRIV